MQDTTNTTPNSDNFKYYNSPQRIMEILPQRPPFLFVDNIISLSEDGKLIQTSRLLTEHESFWPGHFPEIAIMPGVLILEALFQSGGLLLGLRSLSTKKNELGMVTKIENSRFKKIIRPGDLMIMHVELLDSLNHLFIMQGKCFTNDQLAASSNFSCALVPSNKYQLPSRQEDKSH